MLPLLVARIISEDEEELNSYIYPYFTPGGLSISNIDRSATVPFRSEIIKDGEVLIPIAFESQIIFGTPRTLHELTSDTTDIQCPAGKTAKIILFLQPRFSTMTIQIRSSVTANVANGTVLKTLIINSVDAFITIDAISLLASGFLTINITADSGDTVDVEGGAIIISA